jgi:peptidoglycan/LPS O-acetylase OafA/YrhL
MLLVGVLLSSIPQNRFVVMATAGTYSYSIYLWHVPLNIWGIPLLEYTSGRSPDFSVQVAVSIFGSLALGLVMAKIVESPALRLRDRWFPSRAGGAVTTALTSAMIVITRT